MSALDMLKLYLGITDNTQDVLMDSYITRAQDMVDAYMGFPMREGTYTDERVEFQEYIYPKVFPIISVASITLNNEVQDLANFWIEKDPGLIYKVDSYGHILCLPPNIATITYTAGYASPYPGWLNEIWALTALYINSFVAYVQAGGLIGSAGGGGSGGSGSSISGAGVKEITVEDIYTIEYFQPSVSYSFQEAFKNGELSKDVFYLIPPSALSVLTTKRMRYLP